MEKKPFVLRMSDDLAERVDDWRVKRRPVPTKAEAIRQLVERGLDAPEPKRQKPPHQT